MKETEKQFLLRLFRKIPGYSSDYHVKLSVPKHNSSAEHILCHREIGNNTYNGTTWQIKFTIYSIDHTGTYKLQLALATAHESELQVR